MFQHLLVLLDGSERAELALPIAARLVHATGASLTLVRIMTLPPDFVWFKLEPPFSDREILRREMLQASTYLKGKAWELERTGIAVQTHLLPGLAFPQLQELLEEQEIDLVVMCRRGWISYSHHPQSSMAWRMFQQSQVPVLMLQETIGLGGTLSYRGAHPVRIMVPLDGSAFAETALAPAAYLAAALSAPELGNLHLVSVLPFADCSSPGEPICSWQEHAWNERLSYLQAIGQTLLEGDMEHLHLSVTTAVLAHADIAEAIVQTAESKQPGGETDPAKARCDILALTTHARGGRRSPSVGSKLFQETHLPLLVIHPPLDERQASKVGSTALAAL